MKAVIFDFNGTMVFDSLYQEKAWRAYLKKLLNREVTKEEFKKYIHGVNAIDTFNYFLDHKVSKEESDRLEEEKEEIYRKLIIEDSKLKLVEGLPEFLDNLKSNNIPMTIATASNKNNVLFFFDLLALNQWFDLKKVVFNDGTIPGKPDPAIFLRAAEQLKKDIKEITIFEDSYSGLKGAINSGAKEVIAIHSDLTKDDLEELGVKKNLYDFKKV